MSADLAVSVDGLWKKYCRSLKRSLWYGLRDIGSEAVGRRGGRRDLRPLEFWALSDVGLTVKPGEMLALLGQNGSGKSTLLKLMNGLLKPDRGEIRLRGRVQALIELGAGFNPILTGRENVYINAAVIGIPRRRVDELLPEIIEFSGIGEFIDSPVQSYSSGMRARLGFSVAAQLDPDVLLIDEVLAVGDLAFQEKCMRRMDSLRSGDAAIVFVTHNLYQVEALCDTALWLDAGRVVRYGPAGEVVRAYLDDQEERAMKESASEGVDFEGRATAATRAYLDVRDREPAKPGADMEQDPVVIKRVEILDSSGAVTSEIGFGSGMTVRIQYDAKREIPNPLFNLRILTSGTGVFEASMLIDGPGPDRISGSGHVDCVIPSMSLTPKVYDVLLFVRSGDGIANVTTMRTVTRFRVTEAGLETIPTDGPMAMNHLRRGSPVYVPHTWVFSDEGTRAPAGMLAVEPDA